jgi:hypothetical protein
MRWPQTPTQLMTTPRCGVRAWSCSEEAKEKVQLHCLFTYERGRNSTYRILTNVALNLDWLQRSLNKQERISTYIDTADHKIGNVIFYSRISQRIDRLKDKYSKDEI